MPSAAASSRRRSSPPPGRHLDIEKFEHVHQIGGIKTATFDYPAPNGNHGCRVALVDTGSGLRFVVALDRGGDIVEAHYNQHSLCYLTPNGYKPPNHAYHHAEDWLTGWPGGLLTTCGPQHIGPPRTEDDLPVSLHGRFSNTPAAVEMVLNPDPHRGRFEMLIAMHVRDTRMYGPSIEVRRQIQCVLGKPEIHLYDQITNRDNQTVAHNWLYHVNLGYPLLDAGAKLVLKGKTRVWQPEGFAASAAKLNRLKTITGPLDTHRGGSSFVSLIEPLADRKGMVHVGLINPKLKLGIELEYPHADLPRLGNWQHLGPAGTYVTGIEPYFGSLVGKDNESVPGSRTWLEPGETRACRMTLRILDKPAQFAALRKHDGPLTPHK